MNFIEWVARRIAAALQACGRVALRQRRARRDDWRAVAQEHFLDRATDGADVEHRQRLWDRNEANAYAMSGWS